MEYRWILFCPQLPAIPSSPRVTIWRKMRSIGALSLDNGLWLLPYQDESSRIVRELQSFVSSHDGSSKTFLADNFDEETESSILEKFSNDRAEEYAEFKEQCSDFLIEIDKETRRKNFSFAEFEENEQDLNKLETWYQKIQQRDFIRGIHAKEAEGWLEKCRETLQEFSMEVFANEEIDHSVKMQFDPGAVQEDSTEVNANNQTSKKQG